MVSCLPKGGYLYCWTRDGSWSPLALFSVTMWGICASSFHDFRLCEGRSGSQRELPEGVTVRFPVNFTLWLPLWHFRLLMPWQKQSRKIINILEWINDWSLAEVRAAVKMRKEDHMCTWGNLLENLSARPCLILIANGQKAAHTVWKGQGNQGIRPSRVRFWITPRGKSQTSRGVSWIWGKSSMNGRGGWWWIPLLASNQHQWQDPSLSH